MSQTKDNKSHMAFTKIYFSNFKALFLANLFFAVPFLVSAGITFGLVALLNRGDVFLLALPIVLCFPFYGGVVQVTKDLLKGNAVKPFQSFKKGLKNNWKLFIPHGIVLYLAVLITFFSVTVYWIGAQANSMLYFFFGLSVVIGILLLFTMYLVPLVTVTVDIKFRYIYKNSFLMAVGELPTNLLITLTLAILGLVVFSLSFLFPPVISLIVIGLIGVLILPSTVAMLINCRLYPKVLKLLTDENTTEIPTASPKSQKNTVSEQNARPIQPAASKPKGSSGTDDYVFHNGRMIKRSQIDNEYSIIDDEAE
ncbi:MAG TPA: DUF624 domain-containing protein [Clostridiales bacterium]|nr:DUF624 domain-containing protein [Clostridiales bacterium]